MDDFRTTSDFMAQKRKAQEAFGGQNGQLSAFAAAKLARQASQSATPAPGSEVAEEKIHEDLTATEVAAEPYDGHHSGRNTPITIAVEGGEIDSRPPKPAISVLSTFTPRSDNVNQDDENCFSFTLQDNETAAFIGEYDINVRSGIITIYGAVLRANSGPTRVCASSVSVLPQIQARQNHTFISISSVYSGLRKLGRLSPLFRNILTPVSESQRSFQLLGTSHDDPLQRTLSPLEIDRDMDVVLRTLSAKSVAEREPPHIMTIGGKSSGKSTFNRILCNHLYSWTPGKKVLYLDLDPGQPEFGPPGQVSLLEVSAPILGPPFAHPASIHSTSYRLIRSHTIAATTFKDDPTLYRACVKDLIRHADKAFPLIINTCGWTSGLGAGVLDDLLADLAVTDAVLLESLDTDLVQSLQSVSNDITLYRIARRAPRPSTRSPAEHRAMQTMVYFHHRYGSRGDVLKFSGKSLSKMRHWNASFAGPRPGIAAVTSYNQSLSPEFLAEALDGSLVAIVVLEQTTARESSKADDEAEMLRDISEHISRTPEDIPYVEPNSIGINRALNPSGSHCIGLGLIRGIDVANKCFQLHTPLPQKDIDELVDKQVVLVRGSFDSPGWAYLEDIYRGEYDGEALLEDGSRPWVSERSQVGIEGAVWRLRHPPLANAQMMNSTGKV